ncbi:MAG: NAD(+)/NADH kinase, partial [Terriglobus roseus]|nr:NAD(+)/NADH kinase [Terriglobus roseus]
MAEQAGGVGPKNEPAPSVTPAQTLRLPTSTPGFRKSEHHVSPLADAPLQQSYSDDASSVASRGSSRSGSNTEDEGGNGKARDDVTHPSSSSSSSPSCPQSQTQTRTSSASEAADQLGPLSPSSELFSQQRNNSFWAHRQEHRKSTYSIDSTPAKQSIMKALHSRANPTIHSALFDQTDHPLPRRGSATTRRLSQALTDMDDLHIDSSSLQTAKLAALASPCFFHKRFDDAVNFDRVLEEIQDDEGMSHSRLMQTAHGVREVSRQLQRRPIRRAVRNVLVVTKARDNELVVITRDLAEWLLATPRYGSDVGVNVYVDAKLRRSKRFAADALTAKDERFKDMLRYWTPDTCWSQPEKFDLVLTLGGDGTVLYTSWLFQRIVPPILSFSLGSLGFLTTHQFSEFRNILTNTMGDMGMRVNLRMR